jgi:hypothetical protein
MHWMGMWARRAGWAAVSSRAGLPAALPSGGGTVSRTKLSAPNVASML